MKVLYFQEQKVKRSIQMFILINKSYLRKHRTENFKWKRPYLKSTLFVEASNKNSFKSTLKASKLWSLFHVPMQRPGLLKGAYARTAFTLHGSGCLQYLAWVSSRTWECLSLILPWVSTYILRAYRGVVNPWETLFNQTLFWRANNAQWLPETYLRDSRIAYLMLFSC